MTATSGCSTSRAPTTSPTPGRNWTTPGGEPAATSASTSRHATSGVCSAGLRMTGFPAASAAVTIPAGMASGKFHGAMTAVTPLPWYQSRLVSPGGDCTRSAAAPSRRSISRP